MLTRYCNEKAVQKAKNAEAAKEPQEDNLTLEKFVSEYKDVEVTIVQVDSEETFKVDAGENSEDAFDN